MEFGSGVAGQRSKGMGYFQPHFIRTPTSHRLLTDCNKLGTKRYKRASMCKFLSPLFSVLLSNTTLIYTQCIVAVKEID